ncbi:Glutamyl-tRNA(Gln) amidotransferase subunit C [Methylacidimicrobium cyclopophantes]|uniref:Aspartyl/glutamyl-tRNA(Asn/Gln) amidotransferase subunit C n=1 Tax=Methylacidimicrobium cyclopophantes TaxID=1041766 RepID=A0A5E6M8U3_9BACT|nr:Asp-tRNA(Asn)/Glu-tRNA(Gln) amidotransferase subunit GatC [Methylacidimicrobium cyclopophantes]VVM05627.1 Glutamyl-tRNA(Gln) amidotransferase subunit C [Methylacidimicrobium cyclopophantes]
MPTLGIDVAYVADLARLRLSPEEIETFGNQLEQVLAYVKKLEEVDIREIVLIGEEKGFQNRLRSDCPLPGLSQKEALQNAPQQASGLFLVPRILE